MDEASARAVTALRAIETTDRDRAWWTDADRTWATRAAGEVVGESASPADFVARRAALALERLGERHPILRRTVDAFDWRRWIAPLVLAVAFVAGVAIDEIGSSGHINILAPPVLGLIAWNLGVYALLALSPLWRTARARTGPGPLRAAVIRLSGAAPKLPRVGANKPLQDALVAFATDWTREAGPLYAARAARILHTAAAVFAAGVIAGLYLRGLAFEYRASWQSTFLDAAQVRAILAVALAPGSLLTGLPIPDVAHIASIRTAIAGQGENAARWLHLYAATIVALVIVPRLVLALLAAAVERRRARAFAPAADDPYFRRLLRGFRAGPLAVHVVPYSFTVPDAAAQGLRDVVGRAFGPRARVALSPSVRYGGEDALPDTLVPADATIVVALFNATATPEAESHGAFVTALCARFASARDCVAIVDETAFRERFPEDDARLAARRDAWRELFAMRRVPVAFIHLARPDLADAEAALQESVDS